MGDRFRDEIEETRSKRQKMREKEQQDKEKAERTRHQTRSTAQVSHEISDSEESPKPAEGSKRHRASSIPRSTPRGGGAASTPRSSRRLRSTDQTDRFAFPDDGEEERKGASTTQAPTAQSRRRENKKSIITQCATPELDSGVIEVPAQKSAPIRSDLAVRNTNPKTKSQLLEVNAAPKARDSAKVLADHDSDVEFVKSENANPAMSKTSPPTERQDSDEVTEVDGPMRHSEALRQNTSKGRFSKSDLRQGKRTSSGTRRLSAPNDMSGRAQIARLAPPDFESTKQLRPSPQQFKSVGRSSGEPQRNQLTRSNSEQNLRTDSSGTFVYKVRGHPIVAGIRSSSVADAARGRSRQLLSRSQDMPGARKPAGVQSSSNSPRHNEPVDQAPIPRRKVNPHFDRIDRERRAQPAIQHSNRVESMQRRRPNQEHEEMKMNDSRATSSKNQASRPRNPPVKLASQSHIEEGFPPSESARQTLSHSANNVNEPIDVDEYCVESIPNSQGKLTSHQFKPTSLLESEQRKEEEVLPARRMRTRSADARSASGDAHLRRLRRNSDIPSSDGTFERGRVPSSNVPVPSVGDVQIAFEKKSREWENQKDNREALKEALTGFMTIKLGLVNLAFNGLTTNKLRELMPELNDIGRIRRLEVNNNKIEQLPRELTSICEDITTFNAAWNRLSEVPNWLCKRFQNLRILNLSFNSLETLPEGLDQLKNLEVLQLNNNGIRYLPRGLGKLSCLTILILSYNKLTALPADLGEENELLSVLDISHNPGFCTGLPKPFERRTGWQDIFIEGTSLYSNLLRPRDRKLEATKLVAFLAGKSQSDLSSIRNDGTYGLQTVEFTGNVRP